MPFTIPNEADAFNTNQAEPDKVDLDILVSTFDGFGVLQGCAVAAQGTPDMTLAVAEGYAVVNYAPVEVVAGNVTITTADGTNARFDLVVVDTAGAKSVVAGTAAANPVFPAIPANRTVLAAVYVPASDTAIQANQITDKRMALNKPAPRLVEIMEEFITTSTEDGELGTHGWGSEGVAAAYKAGEANHPGMYTISTSATISTFARIAHGTVASLNEQWLVFQDFQEINIVVRPLSGITVMQVFAGLSGAGNAILPANSINFRFVASESANWRAVTRSASTETATSTDVAYTAGNWYLLTIRRLTASKIEFLINGVSKATHTANIPTGVCNALVGLQNDEAVAKTLDLDYYSLLLLLGQRFT
jgi:hypothetical protein